jgi:hypothetical protein
MGNFSKLRQWVNRDDGRYHQVGNRNLGAFETAGLLTAICSLLLWQAHAKPGISSIWAYGEMVGGLLLASFGLRRARKRPCA